MIIKLQTILFPYARHREEKKAAVLTKRDKVMADRMVMLLLFIIAIVGAVLFS